MCVCIFECIGEECGVSMCVLELIVEECIINQATVCEEVNGICISMGQQRVVRAAYRLRLQ